MLIVKIKTYDNEKIIIVVDRLIMLDLLIIDEKAIDIVGIPNFIIFMMADVFALQLPRSIAL